jgi:hypothetical protein
MAVDRPDTTLNPGGKFLKAQLRKSVEWGAPL